MNLRTLAAFVIGAAVAGTISAQSVTLRAQIPFSFIVGGVTLPAGEYTVLPVNPTGTVAIRGIDHAAGVFTLVTGVSTPRRSGTETARLVFNRYGDRYFLSQIWNTGNQGGKVPSTYEERELVAHSHSPSRAVVAAAVR